MNSCWCRSCILTAGNDAHGDLNGLTDEECGYGWIMWVSIPASALVLLAVMIIAVEMDGDNARKLLNRGKSEREADVVRLNKLRFSIEMEDDNVPSGIVNPTDNAVSSVAKTGARKRCSA